MRARTSFHRRFAVARIAATLALAIPALAGCGGGGKIEAGAGDAVQATTASVPPVSAPPARFAVRAQRGARLQEGAEVTGADVGVVLPAPAPVAEGYSLRVDTHATVGGGARLVAPAVLLAKGAVVGEVLTDRLQDRGSTRGAVSAFLPVPDVEPTAAVAAAGGVLTVSSKRPRTLAAGAYGDVVLEPRAILRLEGGEYALASLRVAPGASVEALSPARVHVAGRLDAGSDTAIAIAAGAGTARDLRIEVAGSDATSLAGDVETVETPAARLGERSAVRALISVPAGALVVGARASVTGALVANAVLVRTRAMVAFEDGFEVDAVCPAGCDDGNPCTADACVAGACRHDAVAAGTACSDGDACDGEEACDDGGACLAGAAPALDDGNPCTADVCDALAGVSHLPLAAGTSCSDGNACNGEEACDGGGACLAGAAPALDDGNPCTADVCDALAGVSHPPRAAGTSCSDGNACNGVETCDGAGACAAGAAPVIDDGNRCTADVCDAVTGVSHLPLAAGTSCSDGNACNGVETCDEQEVCVARNRPVVDDGDPCTADACDPIAGVSHTPIPGCPAPAAPPPDTTFMDGIAYLYTGEGAVQLGVEPGAIDPARAAVVHGRVVMRDGGAAAPGVQVEVFDHPELGYTVTRADGRFDLAVNGGPGVVLRYTGYGAPVVHRTFDAAVNAHTTAPDVALVRYDVPYTFVITSYPYAQVARGTRVSDASGARQATLIFQPGTSARVELPGGGVLPLEAFAARLTEYTVGVNGPRALPATLPAGFAYLYTVEPSADDAIMADGEAVFGAPVALYVENYRAYAIGARLPVARYDRSIAAWLPQADGLVVKVLSVSGGIAALDVNGDGVAETSARLAALGIGAPELQALATLYPAGRSLWRMSVDRFAPIACDPP